MRIASLTLFSCTVLACMATPLPAQTFDVSVPPGANFDTAEFRLWHPGDVKVLRGVLVLVPGSKDMAVMFFDELIPLRLPPAPAGEGNALELRPLDPDAGFIADPKTLEIQPAADAPGTTYPTSWLPTEDLATAWRALVGGKD